MPKDLPMANDFFNFLAVGVSNFNKARNLEAETICGKIKEALIARRIRCQKEP
jgi:hypothetical protein